MPLMAQRAFYLACIRAANKSLPRHKRFTVIGKPAAGGFGICCQAGAETPKSGAVVHVDAVGDFVGDQIIHHIVRRKNQAP